MTSSLPLSTGQPPAALVAAGGVFLPVEVCYPVWQALQAELRRRANNGVDVRPDLVQAVETIRQAGSRHLAASAMSAPMSVPRTAADMAAPSTYTSAVIGTAALADRLGCSPRHARRLASAAGIRPLGRDRWRATDADRLTRETPCTNSPATQP